MVTDEKRGSSENGSELEAARVGAEERAHDHVSPDEALDAVSAVNLYVEAFVAGARFEAQRREATR